ncbi:hypothetical protein C0995_011749 [Termitomyces sp. Mi166|nr:hypothetical protein C0995_011749 [Termitomyces sp. Mi166\
MSWPSIIAGVAAALVVTFSSKVIWSTRKKWFSLSDLHPIPTVGPSYPLLSYFGAVKLLFNSSRVIQKGYEQYKCHGLFKFADFRSWTIVVSGSQFIEDIRKAPEDVLEFEAAIDELTRELNVTFYDIRDEIVAAFCDLVPPTEGWTKSPAFGTTLNIVRWASVRKLEERQRNAELHGRNYVGKPEDLLSWFMDEVDGDTDEEKLKHVVFHLMIVNFGAVYTIATSFAQALYHLAAHPEYVHPLREEIERVTASEGWTKSSMGELRKLDSFLKESQRMSGLSTLACYRRVRKPFVFSNGTCIPTGMTIAVASWSTHMDNSIYPNAATFDAFRYVDEDSQMVTPSPNFLAFGIGRHMCPGRFFTVVILKAMMSHVLMNYDVKLESNVERPKSSWFLTDYVPNSTANVMFRKRVYS